MQDHVWIVGKLLDQEQEHTWAFEGVFTTEEAAIAACVDESYFVGQAPLNQLIEPDKDVEWPDGYYPMIERTA